MSKNLLKKFSNLCLDDFIKYPVWVQCHTYDYDEDWYDECDEETFRPWTGNLPINPNDGIFLIKSKFVLNDGTEYSGFVTPVPQDRFSISDFVRKLIGNTNNLGLVQPYMYLDNNNSIGFWKGLLKPDNDLKTLYSVLDKKSNELFPIRFKGEQGLSLGLAHGSIHGISYLDGNKIKIKK